MGEASEAERHAVARGTAYHAVARILFLASSYAIHFGMAHLVAAREYGTLGVVISLVTLVRVFFSSGIPQTTSCLIAAEPAQAVGILRTATRIQLIGASGLTALYLAVAGLWAHALGDRTLLGYILLSAPIVPLMAWYQINLAYYNGRLWFGHQAIFISLYSVCRAGFALMLAYLGWAVWGAVGGLVLAVAVAAAVTYVFVPTGPRETTHAWRELVSFSAPLVIGSVGVSVALNLDILVLNSFYPDSNDVGYYNGAMNLGKAPYFLFLAVSATLLPAMSKTFKQHGAERARELAKRSVSLLSLACIPVCVIVGVSASKLLNFVYKEAYTAGSIPLAVLVVSSCFLSLLIAFSAVITAVGRPSLSMVAALVSLPSQLLLDLYLVPRFGMVGAAVGNLIAVALAMILAGGFAARLLGNVFDLPRLAKGVAAAVPVGVLIAYFDGYPDWAVPMVYAAGVLVYGAILVALRGLDAAELSWLLGRGTR